MSGELHIITLNIPYPADYGGIIDSYYRIISLHASGVRVHLHCFEYGRQHAPELEKICESVRYYKRDTSFIKNISLAPFTVNTRNSDQLLADLLNDSHPILFDGLHTTYFLNHPSLAGRRKYVRVHNIEHHYYRTLSGFEKNPARKLYYTLESLKLKHYEGTLKAADYLLTVSQTDQEYFETKYHNAELIPSFHPFDRIDCREGLGDYIVYHGDLSVNENSIVAAHLIRRIFSQLPYKCVIAGKGPPQRLSVLAGRYPNITLIPDPDEARMSELIRDAQINLLFSVSANGLKLKLLIALFSGRHCLVNSNIIRGTLLAPACSVEDSSDGMIERIDQLMKRPLTPEMIAERSRVLEPYYNSFNVSRLMRLIFPG